MAVIENRGGLADPPVIFGWLFDFAVGSAFLRQDHRDWLDTVAVNFLARHPESTFLLVGMTSRSGSASFNQKLSGFRVEAVFNRLMSKGVARSKNVPFSDELHGAPMGEAIAASAGRADGTEEALFRAVLVELWMIDLNTVDQQLRRQKRIRAGMPG